MVVGNVPEAVDFVVAGAGPGGYVAALAAARRGRKVVLVDADGEAGVGGVCLRVGCIPSKALIETADLYHRSANATTQGISAAPKFDAGQFQVWKGGVVDQLTRGVRGLLSKAGVKVLSGRLSLNDAKTAVVNRGDNAAAVFLQFKDLVLATGSAPIELPGLPFDAEHILDSTGALALDVLPERLCVIGGGYIGVELGTAMAKLGAKVTIVEMADRVLPAMDSAIAQVLSRQLKALGIDVLCGYKAVGFEPGQLSIESASGERAVVAADKIVVAVGRRPNSADLGLEKIGVRAASNGLLPVGLDRRLATHVTAIGDLTPGPALAHKASAEAEVAVEALCGDNVAFGPAVIPAVVFSDPEVASAGLSMLGAERDGIEFKETRFPLSASGRAATLGANQGFAQVLSDPSDGTVLGVNLVGPHASDLIAEAVVAIEMGMTLEDLSLCVHPHPTLSEQFAEVAMLGLGKPVHVAGR